MEIFYKKIDVFCKYPWQTEIDYRYISYSKSRKKWVEFAQTDTSLSMDDRKNFIADILGIKSSKMKLIKTN